MCIVTPHRGCQVIQVYTLTKHSRRCQVEVARKNLGVFIHIHIKYKGESMTNKKIDKITGYPKGVYKEGSTISSMREPTIRPDII